MYLGACFFNHILISYTVLEINVSLILNRVDCLGKSFTEWRDTFKTKSK